MRQNRLIYSSLLYISIAYYFMQKGGGWVQIACKIAYVLNGRPPCGHYGNVTDLEVYPLPLGWGMGMGSLSMAAELAMRTATIITMPMQWARKAGPIDNTNNLLKKVFI